MVNIRMRRARATSIGVLSRRQALTGMAALAAGAASMRAWARAGTSWPLWTIEGKGGKVYLTGETPARPTPWRDPRIERLVATCWYTLDHILDGAEANERIHSPWSRGDRSGAERMVERMRNDQPAVYTRHAVGRDKRWVTRIDAMLDGSKPALVLVGLYQVAGPGEPVNARRRMPAA